MTRRLRIDGPTAAVEVMKGALKEIAPPGHIRLQDADWPFWYSIIAEFARSEWSDHQLELAALLSRSMADLEREQYQLRIEGFISERPSGIRVANPRHQSVAALTGRIIALRRSLALHARAKGGDARDIGRRSAIAKAIEEANPLNDPLLGPIPSR